MRKDFKVSKYNYIFSYDGDAFVFNTFSGGLSKLSSDAQAILENFDDYLGDLTPLHHQMINNGFLVAADIDEFKILECLRMKMISQSTKAIYEILPTTACNARCFYCFESSLKPVNMTLETADKVCDFIIEQAADTQKAVGIHWFGGEPLLNPKVISHITARLDKELGKKGVQLSYQMTTNGSLFDDQLIQKAKNDWHISKIQITLDGTKKVYEERKNYYNLPNSFEKVIHNINELSANGIRVGIRLNIDEENIDDLVELVNYLGKELKHKPYVMCYGYPLFGENSSPDERKNALLLLKLNDAILANNLSTSKSIFSFKFVECKCYACSLHSFLINADGKIGKCSLALNDSNSFIGNVFEPLRLTTNYLKWCSPSLRAECKVCLFLPLCQGGCAAGHLGYGPVKHYIYRNCFDDVLCNYVKYLQSQQTK